MPDYCRFRKIRPDRQNRTPQVQPPGAHLLLQFRHHRSGGLRRLEEYSREPKGRNGLPAAGRLSSGNALREIGRRDKIHLDASRRGFSSFSQPGGRRRTLRDDLLDASKNYRYGRLFYELYNGNPIETNRHVLEKIDGTPEGPHTIRSVQRYLEKKNMYSPLFSSAYKIFNEFSNTKEIEETIIQACQLDRRTKEYIGPFSRLLYRLMPNWWYRRDKGLLSRW